MDATALQLTLGAEFDRAPPWARALAVQQRKDRHAFAGELSKLQADLGKLQAEQEKTGRSLGREPDSDGKGGTGLIGDLRKTSRNVDQLLSLKSMGVGFLGALSVFGALILLGVTHWIQEVAGHLK